MLNFSLRPCMGLFSLMLSTSELQILDAILLPAQKSVKKAIQYAVLPLMPGNTLFLVPSSWKSTGQESSDYLVMLKAISGHPKMQVSGPSFSRCNYPESIRPLVWHQWAPFKRTFAWSAWLRVLCRAAKRTPPPQAPLVCPPLVQHDGVFTVR